jgi:hypothetical protein
MIAAVVGEPQLAGPGVPVEPDGVAHAPGEDLDVPAIGPHPEDRPEPRIARQADIAGRPRPHIEEPVGSEGDEPEPVPPLTRQGVGQEHGWTGGRETVFDRIEAPEIAEVGDVERAALEGDAVRGIEPARQPVRRVRSPVAVRVHERMDCLTVPHADEHRPARPQGE